MQRDVRTGGPAGHRRKGVTFLAALGSCALVAASAAPAAAHGAGGGGGGNRYVALGDSYTSGPLIPRQVDANCARSDHNYPSIVAARLRNATFKDVS
ncbi:SGNH/GDSL hydrolase family protein, partial [Streptomyces sp. NPDC054951]